MSSHPNAILQNLSPADLKLLAGALTTHSFSHGEVLGESGAPIERVMFPNSGLISLVVPVTSGEAIEAGVAGRLDVVGAGVVFGGKTHLNTAIVQMPGSVTTIKAADMTRAANASETLRRTLFLHDQFVLAQAQQSAACNALHSIPQRLATWLLRVSERAQQSDLSLTQEFLSQMLGVQRASVSLAASAMQHEGLIRYRRGTIRITDRPKLEAAACECHAALTAQYHRLTAAPVAERRAPAQLGVVNPLTV